MLEFYQAYANYHDLMDLTEELVKFVAMEVNGSLTTEFNGTTIDLSQWKRYSMREAIAGLLARNCRAPPTHCETLRSEATVHELIARVRAAGVQVFDASRESRWERPSPIIFEAVAEEHLIQPTIIYDFPLAVSPLSKVKPDEPDWVERFEFYIGGFELGNAFSELNDPVDQEQRFDAAACRARARRRRSPSAG